MEAKDEDDKERIGGGPEGSDDDVPGTNAVPRGRKQSPHDGTCRVYPERGGKSFTALFRLSGQRYKRTCRKEQDAAWLARRANGVLPDIRAGIKTIPPGADVKAYVFSGGAEGRPSPSVEPTHGMTIEELFQKYDEHASRPGTEASTLCTTRTHLNHLRGFLRSRHLLHASAMRVGAAVVVEYQTHRLRAGRKPVTVNKETDTLGAVFNFGVRFGLIPQRPVAKFEKLEEDEQLPFRTGAEIEEEIRLQGIEPSGNEAKRLRRARILLSDELPDLLRHVATNPRLAVFLVIDIYTGARRSEIAKLKWSDVNLASAIPQIAFRSKKASRKVKEVTRYAPVSGPLKRVLEDYRRATSGIGFLFPKDGTKTHMAAKSFHNMLLHALRGSEFKSVRFHNLRHTLESYLGSHGVDQRDINDILGHANNHTAWRYRHMFPQQKQQIVELLSEFGTGAVERKEEQSDQNETKEDKII